MSKIAWSDDLALGHHLIDEQHKTLVEFLQRLEAAIERGDDKKALLKAFMEVHRYAAYHFDDEEELMKSRAFDAWHVHRYEHQQFLATIENMAEDFRARKAVISQETLDYLVAWHLEHINVADRELVSPHPKASEV